jgi:hypothetical protein
MIAWEKKTPTEAINAGNKYFQNLWMDHIIEVNTTTGKIDWEWHLWDHLIQDYDPTKDNYGVVADHPELVDINTISAFDFAHINSVDYNEEFDQILLTVCHHNEIWVIDHSTTTEEAAGNTSGRYGKGGDLLYRWGNPRNYDAGDINDRKLFRPHNAKWIEKGCPGEGHITIFNNGAYRPDGSYPSVDEIVPPVDSDGNYYLNPGHSFPSSGYGPKEPIWTYSPENPEDFYGPIGCGAQRLPNGNTLILYTSKGKITEVTYGKKVIWDYDNPFPYPSRTNMVFSFQYYPSGYPGLDEILITTEVEEFGQQVLGDTDSQSQGQLLDAEQISSPSQT